MVSSDIAVAGQCGGSRRAAWQGAPYPGTLRMAVVRRKLPPGANQRARETRNSGDKKNENNPQRFAQVRFRHLGNHDPQQTCQRRRRIRVQAWRQYATHPLTLRLIEAGQENPLAQVSTGNLYEVRKYCALSNHCWSGYWIVANRRACRPLHACLACSLLKAERLARLF